MSHTCVSRLTPAAKRMAFIHGAGHTGGCWEETVGAIRKLRPEVETFVADLPGRGGIPGDLASLTIDACASSVADQIRAGIEVPGGCGLTIVGHSLAGVIMAAVVNELGAEKVEQVIFVACCVPMPGQSVIDTLPFGLRQIVRRCVARSPVIDALPFAVTRFCFGNRTTREQRARIRANFCRESSALLTEVPVAEFPKAVRRSWVLPTHDRGLSPRTQRKFIASLGGVE